MGSRARWAVGAAALGICANLLGACSSSPSTPGSSAVKRACQQVSAVLSDGPDPGADPVGYAFAQVLPLRQIHTSDTGLQRDIDALASAYESFYKTNGSAGANKAVNAASAKVNTICPGAAS
jgi:hypothetical protein